MNAQAGVVFAALADPTRRAIFESLRSKPRAVGDIAADFDVSRPAVSQHLRVLLDAQLLRRERSGRENYYALDLRGLIAVRDYVEGFWDGVLGAFQAAAVEESKTRARKV